MTGFAPGPEDRLEDLVGGHGSGASQTGDRGGADAGDGDQRPGVAVGLTHRRRAGRAAWASTVPTAPRASRRR